MSVGDVVLVDEFVTGTNVLTLELSIKNEVVDMVEELFRGKVVV